MSISVHQLSKTYGEQKALNDVSFTIKKGEIVGFLGPNGAGKSTTMKIVTCYLPPTNGQVMVSGFDVETQPMEVRKRVGYLPEHNPLYIDMYVKEALQFSASVFGLKGKKLRQRIPEIIDLVGLQKEKHKKVGALSKGYRQRVGLAQALIHDPEVLILDEPTTGLDPNQIVEIREVIRQISHDKTVLFSSHIMQEVQSLCERVVIINNGELVADQGVEQLITQTEQTALIIEFETPTKADFLYGFNQISSIEELDSTTFKILYPANQDLRSAIFRKVAEENLALVRMEKETVNLEKTFQALTHKHK